ncbi:hypothetical protein LRB28_21695, partial [Stenotrophomonas maltophilia]|nr:hypothetical protein [Stenotrophomonas maltophilia]
MPPELTAALALCRNLPSPPGIALRIIEQAGDVGQGLADAGQHLVEARAVQLQAVVHLLQGA